MDKKEYIFYRQHTEQYKAYIYAAVIFITFFLSLTTLEAGHLVRSAQSEYQICKHNSLVTRQRILKTSNYPISGAKKNCYHYSIEKVNNTNTHTGYTIRGSIRFEGFYEIYISLVDLEQFKEQEKGAPLGGVDYFIVKPTGDEIKKGEVNFLFDPIPAGVYGIIAFHDKEKDGKLNIGTFGPLEPWGMSFQKHKPRLRPPRFDDISFTVSEDIEVGVIIIE